MTAGLPTVGLDIGGTKLLSVRLAGAEVAAEHKLPSPASGEEIAGRVDLGLAGIGVDPGDSPGLASIGMGIPGLVGAEGSLVFSPHLPNLVGYPVAGYLRGRFPGAGVWVGNDANAAVWAEHQLGAARGAEHVLMVTLGTGIGGGMIVGGRLYEGAHRFAGDWGHMIVDPSGPMCPCGKRGCWERRASGSGLGLLAREAAVAGQAPLLVEMAGGDPEAVRGEHVTAAAAARDPEAEEIFRRFAWWLALGVSNLINAFDPDMVVIGGGLIAAGDVLMVPLREASEELVEGARLRSTTIAAATLGPAAGAIGAALLASVA